MTFCNNYEVEEMADVFKHDPILGPGAKYLADYAEIINDNSDGWAYWTHGRKCSDTLSTMLSEALFYKRTGRFQTRANDEDYIAPTRQDIVKACRKIEQFMKRHDALKNIAPPTLADAVQVALF